MADNQIAEKIKKLLNLANSPCEAEATLAMARAQELLAKYNLDYAQVKDTELSGGQPGEKREKTQVNRSAKYQWQVDLWATIAEANFCWHWVAEVTDPILAYMHKAKHPVTMADIMTGVGLKDPIHGTMKRWEERYVVNAERQDGAQIQYSLRSERIEYYRVKRHMLLGRESNMAAVTVMGGYLCDTIDRMVPYQPASRSDHSWRKGCAERLVERIQAQAEERKNASHPAEAGALICLKDVYASEYEANYDARYGAGKYKQRQIEDAEWEAKREERQREAAEAREKAEREWIEYLRAESPEQKKAREKEEAKERIRQERRAEAQDRRDERHWRTERWREAGKVDREAYRAGKNAGDSISLSKQAGASKAKTQQIA